LAQGRSTGRAATSVQPSTRTSTLTSTRTSTRTSRLSPTSVVRDYRCQRTRPYSKGTATPSRRGINRAV
jgi:hypothetical protein